MNRYLPLAAALLLAGCDKIPFPVSQAPPAAAPAPTMAVLDLDAVAKALGRDEVFREQVEAAGQQLRQQLGELSSNLQTQLREEQEKLGAEPSDEQRQQLQRMLAEAQRQVQQGQVLARQKAAEFQTQLARQFRAEVQPVATEVARSRGASGVLLANTLLWFEPAADITGAVIDALRARGAASGAPAMATQPPPAGGEAPAPQRSQ